MYLQQDRITQQQYDFLLEAMAERRNIVFLVVLQVVRQHLHKRFYKK